MSLTARLKRGALSLASGVVLSHAILIAATPLLTRLYTPEDFGLYGVLLSSSAIVSVVLLLRFEAYIPSASDFECRSCLPGALVTIICGTSALALAVLTAVFSSMAIVPGVSEYDEAFGLALLCVLAACALSSLNALTTYASRQELFSSINRARVYRNASAVTAQSALAPVVGQYGLLFGEVVSRFIGVLLLRRRTGVHLSFSWRYTKQLLSTQKTFPMLAAPAALLNAASVNVYAPLMAALFGPAQAGEVFLIYRLVAAPASLLGQTMAVSYVGAVSEYFRSQKFGEIESAVLRSSAVLSLIAVPLFIAVYLALKLFAIDMFGEGWERLSTILLLLAPAFVLQLVLSPFSQSLNVFGLHKFQLSWDASRLVLVILALLLPTVFEQYFDEPFYVSLGAYSCVLTVMYAVQFWYLIRMLRKMDRAERRSVKETK